MSYFLAFCLALCWGTAFLASKNIVDVLPPYWGAFLRVLAGLVFFVILLMTGIIALFVIYQFLKIFKNLKDLSI